MRRRLWELWVGQADHQHPSLIRLGSERPSPTSASAPGFRALKDGTRSRVQLQLGGVKPHQIETGHGRVERAVLFR